MYTQLPTFAQFFVTTSGTANTTVTNVAIAPNPGATSRIRISQMVMTGRRDIAAKIDINIHDGAGGAIFVNMAVGSAANMFAIITWPFPGFAIAGNTTLQCDHTSDGVSQVFRIATHYYIDLNN